MESPHSFHKTTQQLLVKELTNATYKQQLETAWSNKDDPEEPTSAALPHLILLANNKTDPHSRLTAAQWLCRHNYGLPAAVTALIELAFDPNPDVSKNALAQLEALDDPQAIKALKGLVKWGANQDMRSTARHYLLLKTGKQKALDLEELAEPFLDETAVGAELFGEPFLNDEQNSSTLQDEALSEPFLDDKPAGSIAQDEEFSEPFLDRESVDPPLTIEQAQVERDLFGEEGASDDELSTPQARSHSSPQKVELLTTSSMLVPSESAADNEPPLSDPLPVATNLTASQRQVVTDITAETATNAQPRQINPADSKPSREEGSVSSPSKFSELLLQLFRHDYRQPLWFSSLLLALTTIGELLFLLPDPVLGMGVHIGVLFLLLYSLVYVPDRPVRRLNTALLLVPIIRMMSLGLPLAGLPQMSWYILTAIPIFAAIALIARSKDDPWSREELGLTVGQWPIQLAVGLTGIGIGWLEYLILAPAPLSTALTLQAIWLPALILLIGTGFFEELLFRGLLQTAAIPVIGRWPALILISALFAVLHIGYASVIDVLFVFAIGLSFALIVERTRSILGVTLAHGLANISLYLIWPHLLGN